MSILQRLRDHAKRMKRLLMALMLAWQHPDTPFFARFVIASTLAYALSPIDLVPDFIPILGYLDDVILLPFAIWFAIRLIPDPVWQQCLEQATGTTTKPSSSRWRIIGTAFVIILWTAILLLSVHFFLHLRRHN